MKPNNKDLLWVLSERKQKIKQKNATLKIKFSVLGVVKFEEKHSI